MTNGITSSTDPSLGVTRIKKDPRYSFGTKVED